MKTPLPTCEKCFDDFKESLEELWENGEAFKRNPGDLKIRHKVVRSFEVTHELALNTMSEFLKKQGRGPYSGSRDITVDAFHEDLIDDGKGWLDMIIERIKYNPLYPMDYEGEFAKAIVDRHLILIVNFSRKMKDKI